MKKSVLFVLTAVWIILAFGCSSPESELKETQDSNTVESFRSFINKYNNNTPIREKAVDELKNQQIIAMIAVEDSDWEIRRKAYVKITDQSALGWVIAKSKDSELRENAMNRLDDQVVLKQMADTFSAAAFRIWAINKIDDDDFLLKKSQFDISDAVRSAAVNLMKSDETLTAVATSSYYDELRNLAKRKVKSRSSVNKISAARFNIQKKLKNAQSETNQEKLAAIALNGEFDKVSMAAVKRLKDKQLLSKVAIESTDRNIAKIAFSKLDDKTELENVYNYAADDAVKIAAAVKLNQKDLNVFFTEATSKGSSKELGDVLAAVSLLPEQENINTLVTHTCLTLIRRGDESRIPELVALLNTYGDVSLTEDYLNCGQPDLGKAGRKWAYNHGYDIGSGYGSSRAQWGSGS
ncbi:MAG: hypothetical protein RBS07_09660 [Lentimicrobium sp.]|jgi:hypothetical protein|nr:hypothetical protein [Lentimicrobium sp.]